MTNVRGGVPRKSHIIPYGHFLRPSKNVAIPMICVHGLYRSPGNCMRNCFGSSLSSPARLSLRTWASLRTWPDDVHMGPFTRTWARDVRGWRRPRAC